VLEDSEVAAGVLPNSVAVLPFENMSVDPEEAFYASGIYEEILNQLVKLSALNVIARTSMQQYANTEKPIPEIARELNVETVMEGSVRYANGQIRITVQLNDGVTGAHLWSRTYTRDFDDIFAIESDVAMNVANAVGAEFSLEEQASIEKIPTDSPAAYVLYLKAISVSNPTLGANLAEGEPLLMAAIDLDPDFALAYVRLALIYATAREETLSLQYTEKALELDPDSGLAYRAISVLYSRTGRFEEAMEFAEQALQRSPSNSDVLGNYGNALVATGHEEQAIGVLERAIELDPANGELYFNLSWARWHAGDRDRGVVAMRRALELTPDIFNIHRSLGMMEATLGNRAEGAARVRLQEQLSANSPLNPVSAYSYRVVGLHDDAARIARAWAETLEELPQGDLMSVLYHLVLDEEEQALDAFVQLLDGSPLSGGPFTWVMTNAFDDPILDKPEFEALRAEYRAKVGWN